MGNFGSENIRIMDIDHLNGFTLNNITLHEELITNILSYLDIEQILKCRLVCKKWNNIVTTHPLWFIMYKRKYRKPPRIVSWHMYYFLFADIFNHNLLKNGYGENGFQNWTIIENGGDGFKIENPPVSSERLPAEVDEVDKKDGCFVTSFHRCMKSQRIYLKNRILVDTMNKYKPHIYVSEWVAARMDCGAVYEIEITVNCQNKKLVKKEKHRIEQWSDGKWTKVEILIKDYPNNVNYIDFSHWGTDTQFWKGHYGMKMAGGVVKILFETAKEDCSE